MASYWRALCLAGIASLAFGIVVYFQSMPRPGVYFTLPPYIPAAISALFTFCCWTTVQAIWYLIQRRKATAGWLLITAGAPPALFLVVIIVGSFFNVLTDPAHPFGLLWNNVAETVPYVPFPIAWIATGIWLVRLDRRQRLNATVPIPGSGSEGSGKWPPLPFSKKQ